MSIRPAGSIRQDILNAGRGLLMGAADIVPGVSGGTVALILGHYQRLIEAISHLDGTFLRLVVQRKFAKAVDHADLRFLLALAVGVSAGILMLASLMHFLLEEHMGYTFAVFTGLILASSVLVAKQIGKFGWVQVCSAVGGALLAIQICRMEPFDGSLSLPSVFLSATVAICAMILPGISGAFVLLLLGIYHPVTGMLKEVAKLQWTTENLSVVFVFCAGCGVGLLVFSRLLKWLLREHAATTTAFLTGLMLGSLYRVWPFQQATAETQSLEFKERHFELLLPWQSELQIWLVVGCVVAGVVLVFGTERLGKKINSQPANDPAASVH